MLRRQRLLLLLCLGLNAISFASTPVQEQARVEYLHVPNLSGTRGGNLVLAITDDPTNFNQMFAF